MKVRNSNIELLRMIAMMGIVALHYVNANMGGVENYAVFPNFTWFFVCGVRSIAIPLVNVFVLITGYFLINSKRYSFRKPVDLLMIVFFYGFVLYIISSLLRQNTITASGLIHSILPFFYGSDWFIKTYIILILLAPFMNKGLTALSINGYRRLLVVQILLFSVWYSVGFSAPIVDDGYGIINFVTLYVIGGYIGRFENECKCLIKLKSKSAFLGYGICVLLTAMASIFINPFGYAFFTNIIGAALLLIAIVKKPQRHIKAINILSSNAFDVFFVHGYFYVLLGISTIANTKWVLPHIFVTVIVCYLIGFVCGGIRKIFFKFTVNKVLDRSIKLNQVFTE